MSLPHLTIIPAGAGSGKTYTIQTRLFEWVDQGLVRPEKIAAVTFTEAAAAELRGRIRAELIKGGKMEEALRLDQAYISTIHSFGLRIITEFAFEAGESPQPRLLNDAEKDILIRLALARTDKADEIKNDLEAFGYTYDFNSGETSEDRFRGTILGLIEKLRSIGTLQQNTVLLPYALKKIEQLYGATDNEEVLNKDLLDAVKALLKKFPTDQSSSLSGTRIATAQSELKANFSAITRARNGGSRRDWSLWQELRNMRVSNKQVKLPQGYDPLAKAVREAADALPVHPGPLRHALAHAQGLLGASQDCLTQYSADKKGNGLVDYVDMVDIARKLLTKANVLEELKSRMDCVVIDEFQDTNPIQFSLLWALHKVKIPTLVVGDLKQAIMGFQHADPRLLAELSAAHPKESKPLTANWRSSEPLMKWINVIGGGLFGKGYQSLTPKSGIKSAMDPLEVVDFSEPPYRGSTIIPAQYTALRVRDLLNDGKQKVYAGGGSDYRPLRGSDIAVLCPTNKRLKNYAEALAALGIRTRMDQDGWFQSPVIQAAYHALSYAADPTDRHAAFYLAVAHMGSHDLAGALKKIMQGQEISEPFFEALRAAGRRGANSFVDAVVGDVISAMDIYGVVSLWPDAAQARANLLRLQGEAREFMGANREALASGGFYGAGIKPFLAWLRKKVEIDDSQPAARTVDEDAVQLATWHKSKGREWPVVVVASADYKRSVRLPRFDVEYDDFKDLDRILDRASITISPNFDAPEAVERFAARHRLEMEDEDRRLLYVALTRAKEKVILEWPRYQEASNAGKRAKGDEETISYWTTLRDATGMELVDGKLAVNKSRFNCVVTTGGKHSPPIFEEEPKQAENALPVIGRRAIKPGTKPEKLTPEAITPSSLHGAPVGAAVKAATEAYGSGLDALADLPAEERGTVLHRCFEIMGAGIRDRTVLSRAADHDVREEDFPAIEKAVADFEAYIRKRFAPQGIEREVPVLSVNAQGSVVAGSVDLLIETREGLWIIDHKTDRTDDIDERFRFYLAQLMAYADCAAKARKDKPVLGVGINWISRGRVTSVPF